MNFGEAFECIKSGRCGMRLPHWKPDVAILVQRPDESSKMTAPYLYVSSDRGRVPRKESICPSTFLGNRPIASLITMIELFDENWELC